ncbi:unnamed protein product [Lactuca virosa]|uniref:Uncharacterized protein n=1 Tax=Lactuca virosa TaxID=75947 RepID=A0AAU9NXY0_9ASTR|nr:unnamed protein product [Lactuca virosa]
MCIKNTNFDFSFLPMHHTISGIKSTTNTPDHKSILNDSNQNPNTSIPFFLTGTLEELDVDFAGERHRNPRRVWLSCSLCSSCLIRSGRHKCCRLHRGLVIGDCGGFRWQVSNTTTSCSSPLSCCSVFY